MIWLFGVQARSGSTRLPGKIYQDICGLSLLERVMEATQAAAKYCQARGGAYKIATLTAVVGPTNDEKLKDYCEDHRWTFLGGHEEDIIWRYADALKTTQADGLIRITSDCWNIHPARIAQVAEGLVTADYASNCIVRTYPEGQDCQACRTKAFEWFDKNQKCEREHPFYPFEMNQCVRDRFQAEGYVWVNYADLTNPAMQHNSIDTLEDLQRAKELCETRPQPLV